jgi:two-component system sensor histidine kinase BaeS
VLFVAWFGFWLPRSIARPLEALTRSATAIGERRPRAIARDRSVALEVDAAAQIGSVSVDPERWSIALANLVSNAIRRTPAGGRVLLRAARTEATLRIEITDTGEGISPESLPRIFDRSFTSSAGDGGQRRHGLGLTIAREIVLQHGGELLAASEPGKGSVFTIVLPLDPPA